MRDRQDVVAGRLDVDAAIEAWAAAGSTLDEVSRRAVVAAVAHELHRPSGPRPDWTSSLYDFDGDLLVEVDDAARLRAVLHEALVTGLPPDEMLDVQHHLGLVLDDLIATAAARRVAALEQTALLDPLTGLRNRRAATIAFEAALAHARRHERAVAVAAVDLDGLKAINDTCGHGAGDEVLRQFAAAVSQNLRPGDSAFRYGGDEFVVLAPDTSADELRHLFTRLERVAPSFTVGIAEAPLDGEDAAVLLAVADARLYAERRGRRADRPKAIGRLGVGVLAGVSAAVAAGFAEAIRSLASVSLDGLSVSAWRAALVAAPLVAGGAAALAGPATRRDAWARSSALAGIVLLALVAMLTPQLPSAVGQPASDPASHVTETTSDHLAPAAPSPDWAQGERSP